MRSSALLAVLFLGVVSAQQPEPKPAPAQQPPPEQPIFRATVDLVRVDVSVTGRGDEPVTGLTAEDFEVKEDGVIQKVETVQFVQISGERTSDLNEGLEIRSPEHARLEAGRDDVRLFAIFLDDYHIDKAPQIILPLRDALKKFVESLKPNDLILLMDPLTPLSHVPYTRSKADILERIRTLEGRRGEIYPVKSASEEAQLSSRNVWELRAGVSLSALEAIATHLGGLREGRKSVLFVSQGPPAPPGSPNELRLRDAIQAANRGNVQINVLDPRPLGSAPFGGSDTGRRLANETGGRAIVNTNDPEEGLKRVVEDASAYYLVGYAPARPIVNDGKFHEIDVRVKRGGMRVSARKGYWAPSEDDLTAAAKVAPEVAGVREARERLTDADSSRPVDLWIGAERAADGTPSVAVTWEPRPGAEQPVRLEVQPIKPGREETPLADAQTIEGKPFISKGPLVARFALPAGEQTLRLTALAQDGTIVDRWTEQVVVPEYAQDTVALTTPRIYRARSPFEARALEKDPSPTPVAARTFRRSDRVFVELDVLTGAAPATLTAQLLSSEGQKLLDLDAPAASSRRARIPVPIASLAPGLYIVRIEAAAGGETARQIVALRVGN